MNASQPLESPRVNPHTVRLWFTFGTFELSIMAFVFFLLIWVPQAAEMYFDFGANLPLATQVVIDSAMFVKGSFFPVTFALGGLGVAAFFFLRLLDRKGQGIPMVIVALIPVAVLLMAVWALYLPDITPMETP